MEAIIRRSPKLWMVTIYLFVVAIFLYLKPSVIFDKNGNIRNFGTDEESDNSTLFPIWLWIFAFAAISYLSVVYLVKFDLPISTI
jgi:hypothetical protein